MAPDALPEAQPQRQREGTRRGDQAHGGAGLADGDDHEPHHRTCGRPGERPRSHPAVQREPHVALAVRQLCVRDQQQQPPAHHQGRADSLAQDRLRVRTARRNVGLRPERRTSE